MKNLKTLKRSLALLLALVLCLSVVNLSAFAAEGEEAPGAFDGPGEVPVVTEEEPETEEPEAEEPETEEPETEEPETEEPEAEEPEVEQTEAEEPETEEPEAEEPETEEPEAEEPETEEPEAKEPEDEPCYTVIWKWAKDNDEVYTTKTTAELDENGRPIIEDPEEDPIRENYVFMGWSDNYEQDAEGNYVTFGLWEKDVLVDPLVPESERGEWGDGIPDDWQIKVSYYVNNGSFTFEGKENLRCALHELHSDTGPACYTVVTKRDENGNPTKWYKGCTATLTKAHLPTGVPDKGYTKGTWYYSDYNSPNGAPAEGLKINAGSSSVTYRLVYSDPSTKVTVTYRLNSSEYTGYGFKDKNAWYNALTVELDKGEWYRTWTFSTEDYVTFGWKPNRVVDDIDPTVNGINWMSKNSPYSITDDLVLTLIPGMGGSGSATVGTPDSSTVTYQWGDVTPKTGNLPTAIGYYAGATVGIANGPSGIVTGKDGNQYIFKGWKLTEGTVANNLPSSQIVARSVTLTKENIVLTAQWRSTRRPRCWCGGWLDMTAHSPA